LKNSSLHWKFNYLSILKYLEFIDIH